MLNPVGGLFLGGGFYSNRCCLIVVKKPLITYVNCSRMKRANYQKPGSETFLKSAAGRNQDSGKGLRSVKVECWHYCSLISQAVTYSPFRCPMVSLSYLPRMASAALPYGGVVAGTLEGGCFWEQKASNTYRPHHLPLEPGGCIDIQTEISTRHCLATYRPSK